MNIPDTNDYDSKAIEIVRILDQYVAELKAGGAPSREELLKRHPHLAGQLDACLAGLEFIHSAEIAGAREPHMLGDFRILREVGRGGMGAVFEAEQISLGRRVALKILRFGGVSDPEAVERFKREAETVANLHHTNIVPIFAVGSERGVNYFAMQFIEGESLAELLARNRRPLAPVQVAEFGLQAAEALAHAHQRGVIHRDVKPSNLIVDRENRLWLTDFGLARRMDDVSLSLTGALLGTPRYMSPEQAVAARKQVDHRSDLFSLGATLYELLTAEPAFAGETPHDVIQQILSAEPKPIRQRVKSVPRDLETIVMKCLAKGPGQRYTAASDLAFDLRAFLDDRPIRARRASPVERTAKWLKRQERSVKLTAAAVAATLVLVIASIAGWSAYDSWRQATIQFGAINPPLVTEVLDAEGNVREVATAPMQRPAKLPTGDYKVRVSAVGELSQTFDLALPRGQQLTYELSLTDQMLWTPQEVERSFATADFGDGSAIVILGEKGIRVRRYEGQPLDWSLDLSPNGSSALADSPGFRWLWAEQYLQNSGYGQFDYRPWVSPKARDLNGDGVHDLIFAARHQPWLMAIAGDGKGILWFAGRGAELKEPLPKDWENRIVHDMRGAVWGDPITSHDCDEDGTTDVIATFVAVDNVNWTGQNRHPARRWIEAVSGRSGETIWIYELPEEWFELAAGSEAPRNLQWYFGSQGGTMSGGGSTMNFGRNLVRTHPNPSRTSTHVYCPTAVGLVSAAGQSQVACVAGTRLVMLDPQRGKAVRPPAELNVRPGIAKWAELDGDGNTDLVLLEEVPTTTLPNIATARLVGWSAARGKSLWARNLDADWPWQPGWTIDAPKWPRVVDLDRDGKAEVVVPDGRSTGGGGFPNPRTPWGAVAVLAGDTGSPRWTRKLVSIDRQIDHFIAGPDLDQDGRAELFAASITGTDYQVNIDCLSGHDGRTLWTSQWLPRHRASGFSSTYIASLDWTPAGRDGWPSLIARVVTEQGGSRESSIALFSGGTGTLASFAAEVDRVESADIDGDAVDDLVVFQSNDPDRLDARGQYHCVRGLAAEPWRRLGDLGAPVADFDGDGVDDLVRSWADGTLVATSGLSGGELWQSRVVPSDGSLGFRSAGDRRLRGDLGPRSSGDLNGDGITDILLWKRAAGRLSEMGPLYAVSGRTGELLWNAREIEVHGLANVIAAEPDDLDGDGRLEVAWLVACDYGYPARVAYAPSDAQLWLFVTSGQSGELRWSQALSPDYRQGSGSTMPYQLRDTWLRLAVDDLNGDGTRDIIAPAIRPDGLLETRALSGKDGRTLWNRLRPGEEVSHQSLQRCWITPRICDLDGNGLSEVAVIEPSSPDKSTMRPRMQIALLDAKSGRTRWTYVGEQSASNSYTHLPVDTDSFAPVILRDGPKRERVAAVLPGLMRGELVILDTDGRPTKRTLPPTHYDGGLWACDVDGDGSDEVVFKEERDLIAARPDRLDEPVWKRTFGSSPKTVLAIEPARGRRASIIAVATQAGDNRVVGLDAATGKTVWTCPGPVPRGMDGTSYLVPNELALLGANDEHLPLVLYTYGFVNCCRQAVLHDVAARAPAEASFATRGVSVTPAILTTPVHDPRWKRSLPWHSPYDNWRQALPFFGWAMFFSLVLVVVPAGYCLRLIARRQFSLLELLVLPVVLGIFFFGAFLRAPLDNDFEGLPARLAIGTVVAPNILLVAMLVRWALARQWKRITGWIAFSLLVAIVFAGLSLYTSLQREPLAAEETYDLAGWYVVWFPAVYLTACLVSIGWLLRSLGRMLWQLLQRRRLVKVSHAA